MNLQTNILITPPQADYELLDSGDGEKMERFGNFVLSRPDPQALWKKRMSGPEWKKVDGHFTRDDSGAGWSLRKDLPDKWQIKFGELYFWIKPTAFKHTGIFPEQLKNWEWMKNIISAEKKSNPEREIEVLNLFGYTGGASLACSEAGSKAVHVDGSKAAITWARDNAEISGLSKNPIRWILEDVRTFVKREIKRERKYAGIIMDPPSFGHGPESELWKIEEDFLPLIDECAKILEDKPLFFLVNGYSAGYSAIAYKNSLLPIFEKNGGEIEIGELTIKEKDMDGKEGRLLPSGIFARWSHK